MEDLKPKRLLISATFFILGVTATIAITKYSDKLFPEKNEPLVIKEIADTIKVIHEYKLPKDEEIKSAERISKIRSKQLNQLNEDLKVIESLKKDQSTVDSTINSLKTKISNENAKLFKENYNEIINIRDIFPKLKGHTASGQSSNFIFSCPTTDSTKDYIDLSLNIYDAKLVDKIACLYISIVRQAIKNGKTELYYVFDQAYSVKSGVNIIKIRNYFKQRNLTLEIGYLLKSDSNKEFPHFERIACNL